MNKALRGTKDILPKEAARWQEIEKISRRIFDIFGYSEIRTPIIEETGLFVKSVGEDTDIVKKEMFSFTDRGERDISLRPEGTAPIVRAYLENNLNKTEPFQKFYYIGPMFRAERPQAGRMRQFSQIGVEAIGSNNPALDAEVINVMLRLLEESGVKKYSLKLNNLGCKEDKKKLSSELKTLFSVKGMANTLCEDCKRRLNTNPLRVIDCKNETCMKHVRESFKAITFLCNECNSHFKEVLKFLELLKVQYVIDPYIVRGLDYYTRTVFEVTHEGLGAQNAIGAGGRYDNLINDMNGPKTGACGFALGMERLLLAMEGAKEEARNSRCTKLFIATLGKSAFEKAFQILNELRNSGIACDMDYENRSLKSQMRAADDMGAAFVLIIGDDELSKGEAVLRNMETKEQTAVKFSDVINVLKGKLC